MNSNKKVGTFTEFSGAGKRKQRINENLEITVDWWDDCIAQVIQVLKEKSCGDFSWESLISYAKTKFSVLGRNIPQYDDEVLIEMIKELIFEFHGDSLVVDGSYFSDNEDTHTKGVVIEKLAKAILDRVKEITDKSNGEKATTRTELCDKERTKLVPCKPIPVNPDKDFPDENCEDLPVDEGRVAGFENFSKKLLEESTMCSMTNYREVRMDVLNKIYQEAGSLKIEDILKIAKNKKITVYNYIRKIVDEIVRKESTIKIKFKGRDSNISREMTKQIIRFQKAQMADEIMDGIYIHSGVKDKL